MTLPYHRGYVLRARLAIYRKTVRFAPSHKCVDLDVDLLDSDALAFKVCERLASALMPLLVRVIQLSSVFNNLRKALPLFAVEPRETNRQVAVRCWGRALGHVAEV
jgi:hypothetical protein